MAPRSIPHRPTRCSRKSSRGNNSCRSGCAGHCSVHVRHSRTYTCNLPFFKKKLYHDAEQPLKAWFREVLKADWKNPGDVKMAFRNASVVGNNRVVFNIAGNKYRLVVRVNYPIHIVYIRFIGTHRQYDEIDATEV